MSSSSSDDEDKKHPENKRANKNKLNVGDFLSMTEYYKVTGFTSTHVLCITPSGKKLEVGNGVINNHCFSADQYEEEHKVTRTELVHIFVTRTGDKVFTVEFDKLLTPEVLEENLQQSEYRTEGSAPKRRKILKQAMVGPPRRLVGYMKQTDNGMGRSEVYDLEQPEGKNTRQVDHRTIRSLVLMGVKYSLKK